MPLVSEVAANPACGLWIVLNIIQLSTNLLSSVGNLIISLPSGLTSAVISERDWPMAFSAFALPSAFNNASSVILDGILDNLIPVFIAIRSSNAPLIFELNDALWPPSAEFKSSLIEPSSFALRDLKKFI